MSCILHKVTRSKYLFISFEDQDTYHCVALCCDADRWDYPYDLDSITNLQFSLGGFPDLGHLSEASICAQDFCMSCAGTVGWIKEICRGTLSPSCRCGFGAAGKFTGVVALGCSEQWKDIVLVKLHMKMLPNCLTTWKNDEFSHYCMLVEALRKRKTSLWFRIPVHQTCMWRQCPIGLIGNWCFPIEPVWLHIWSIISSDYELAITVYHVQNQVNCSLAGLGYWVM